MYCPSIEEVALCHRQYCGRLAGQMHAVGSYLISFRVDLDMRYRGVVNHAALVDCPDAARRQHHTLQSELLVDPALDGDTGQKGDGGSRKRAAEGAKHWTVVDRLRRCDRGVRVTHQCR